MGHLVLIKALEYQTEREMRGLLQGGDHFILHHVFPINLSQSMSGEGANNLIKNITPFGLRGVGGKYLPFALF